MDHSGPWNAAFSIAKWKNHEAVFFQDDTLIYDGVGAEFYASFFSIRTRASHILRVSCPIARIKTVRVSIQLFRPATASISRTTTLQLTCDDAGKGILPAGRQRFL